MPTSFTSAERRWSGARIFQAWSLALFCGLAGIGARASDSTGGGLPPVVNRPPVVQLDGPTTITRSRGDTTTFTATASDPDGKLELVSFILDGQRIWSDANPPYTATVGTLAIGTHTLYAMAVDTQLGTGVSGKVVIQVGPGLELPEVMLTTDDGTADEADPTNIMKFTLSRSGNGTQPLRVYFQVGGTAKQGVDYDLIPESEFTWCPLCLRPTHPPLSDFVDFAAGVAKLQFGARALPDSLEEGLETLSVTLIPTPDFRDCVNCPPLPPLYYIHPGAGAKGVIVDASTAPLQGQIRWIRPAEGQNLTAPADLHLEVLASVNRGFVDTVEFLANGKTIGKSAVPCPACELLLPPGVPQRHGLVWSNVTAGDYTLEAVAWVGTNRLAPTARKIHVGPPVELPTITVTATRPVASEPNPLARMIPVDFVLTRTGPTNRAVRVRYSLGGTARNGRDYTFLDGDEVIPAGSVTQSIRLEPLSDTVKDPDETVVLTLRADRAYQVGTPKSATVTITDVPPLPPVDPPPEVSLTFLDPLAGAHIPLANEIPLRVKAQDSAGYFSTIEFLVDGVSIGVSQLNFFREPDPGTPIEHAILWKSAKVGAHTLSARGKSSRGAVASTAITVIVQSVPIDLPLLAHPADGATPNFVLTDIEAGNYAAAWKGGVAWSVGPNPVPVSYVTRAGFLLQSGGAYRYDATVTTAPMYWVPMIPVVPAANVADSRAAILNADASQPGDPAANDLPAATLVNTVVAEIDGVSAATVGTLKLRVTLAPGTKAWAVEENLGLDAVVTEISEGGILDGATGVVRWGPFYDTLDRTLVVSLKRELPLRLTGVASFDGVDQRIPHRLAPPPLPGNVVGAPRIASVRPLDSGAVQLLIVDDSAGGCDVEVSSDMVVWEKIGEMDSGLDCANHLDTDAGENPVRFYRVVRR